jgi:hypothetical protein
MYVMMFPIVLLIINLDGHWLLPDAARRLACNAGLLVVKEDGACSALDIGRKSGVIPPAMSQVLGIRDGGETKLDNLVTLCKYHHRELHKETFCLYLRPESV